MSIQKQFVIRYRQEGHVRFLIPESLSDANVAQLVTEKIAEIDGVYRVKIYRNHRKLSIRYQETSCDFVELIRQLYQLIAELDKKGLLSQNAVIGNRQSFKTKITDNAKNLKVSRWFSEKYQETKETIHAAKIITKLGLKKPNALVKDPEKAIIDFCNDILVLYLIKVHWTRITQEWIPKPLTYRYEWTAVFYMFYLLIRSRKPRK